MRSVGVESENIRIFFKRYFDQTVPFENFLIIVDLCFMCLFLHFKQASLKSKLYGIGLIDSIVVAIKSPYRELFGGRLPMLVHHILSHPHAKHVLYIREMLCEARQSWNGIFSAADLQRIDDVARNAYGQGWSIQTYNRRELITQLNAVKNQLAMMQKEVYLLEMEAKGATNRNFTMPMNSLANSIALPYQNQQNQRVITSRHTNVDLQTQTKIEKRFSQLKSDELPLPKRTNYERNLPSPNADGVNSFHFSQSSVSLTPSPEPQDRLSPSTSSTSSEPKTNKNLNSNSNFWMSMTKMEEQQPSTKLFFPLLGENIENLF